MGEADNYWDYITIEKVDGLDQPVLRGKNVTLYDVLEFLAEGKTEDELFEKYPQLNRLDLLACYAFVAEPGRRIYTAPP